MNRQTGLIADTAPLARIVSFQARPLSRLMTGIGAQYGHTRKAASRFRRAFRHVCAMPSFATEPNHELITALILEAVRLVEDAAPGLVRTWPVARADQEKRIGELAELAEALSALSAAATALHRRRPIKVSKSS